VIKWLRGPAFGSSIRDARLQQICPFAWQMDSGEQGQRSGAADLLDHQDAGFAAGMGDMLLADADMQEVAGP